MIKGLEMKNPMRADEKPGHVQSGEQIGQQEPMDSLFRMSIYSGFKVPKESLIGLAPAIRPSLA